MPKHFIPNHHSNTLASHSPHLRQDSSYPHPNHSHHPTPLPGNKSLPLSHFSTPFFTPQNPNRPTATKSNPVIVTNFAPQLPLSDPHRHLIHNHSLPKNAPHTPHPIQATQIPSPKPFTTKPNQHPFLAPKPLTT